MSLLEVILSSYIVWPQKLVLDRKFRSSSYSHLEQTGKRYGSRRLAQS